MLVSTDDATHSVLSRARPIQQSGISAFLTERRGLDLIPRSDFGTYEVREVDAKQALTVCRMPGEPWSLNPYMGCSHDCGYCYVPDVAHVERPKWGSYVVVKRNLPTLLAHELKRKERRDVFMSSATDPYQPAEATHLVTRRCLEILARHDWPLYVLSRNPLMKRDLDLFHEFTDVGVGMSVPTVDDDLRRLVEPGAPPIEGRLRTLRALADAGLEPFANLMPPYPLLGGVTPDGVARAFQDAGVAVVKSAGWRYVPSITPVLRERLAGTEYEGDFLAAIAEPRYAERMFRALKAAFARRGVPFEC